MTGHDLKKTVAEFADNAHFAVAIWEKEDVQRVAKDAGEKLSLRQVNEALELVDRNWDAETGITHDSFTWAIAMVK